MEVKDIQGNILIDALVTEQAVKVDELMKQHSITLSWVSVTDDELPLGAYIEHEGVRYSLLAPYKPEQSDEAIYAYKPVFEHPIMRWQYIPFFFYTYSEGKVVSKELDWNLTDNPANFMKAVCDAILNETGEDWSYEISADLSASASQSFSNTDIFSALNAIAGAFETEWWFDYANKIVYLSKASFGSAVTLEVGQNIGVPSKNQSKDGYYTRFYAFGSTRNIEQNYAGSNVNSIVNKRLTLNPAKYPNGYIDIREGLTESEILVKTLVFDDIYPRSSLTIADVKVRLMWRLDSDKKKVQIGTDSNGNPVYDQYAIWYFKVPGLQFDKDSIISGKPLSVHFNSGALNGREFELTYHDTEEDVETSDGTSIHVEKGDFEINFIEEGTYIIPAISGLVPNDGDEITLFNIKMPEEYKTSAYNDLEEAVLKEIAKQDVDNNNYTFESNKEAFYESNPNLTVGRKVLYKNGNSVLETRVIKLETQLDYAFEQKITIGNEQIKGNTQTLKEEVVNANQNIDLISAINESTQQLVQSYQRTQKALLDSMAKWGDMWQLDKQNNAVRTPLNLIVEGGGAFGKGSGGGGDVPTTSNVVIKFEGDDDVYAPVNGVITLPAYPEGGGGVADSVDWANVYNKPTTLGGYGITDALSVSGGELSGNLTVKSEHGNLILGETVSWQGNEYPTIFSSAEDRYVMIPFPHIQRYEKTEGETAAQIRFEGENLNFWDIWVDKEFQLRYNKNGYNVFSFAEDGTIIQSCINDWLMPANIQIGRKSTDIFADRACIGVTDGNLHIDAYEGKDIYLNFYSTTGKIFFHNTSAYIFGSYFNGTAASANYAKDAGTVGGYSINRTDNPFNAIPVVGPDGVMEVGKYIDFHNDNTTGNDFGCRLQLLGNYNNYVNLPINNGTLALLTDNVASATKLQTARTIWGQSFDGTGDIWGGIEMHLPGNWDYTTLITPSTNGLTIETYQNNVAYKNVMLNPNGGNVLIGTTEDSSAKLRIQTKRADTFAWALGSLASKSDMALEFYENSSNIYGLYTAINAISGDVAMQVGRSDGGTSAYNLILNPLGGNVLVGTTNDYGYKLNVNGKIGAKDTISVLADAGYYQFSPDGTALYTYIGHDKNYAYTWLYNGISGGAVVLYDAGGINLTQDTIVSGTVSVVSQSANLLIGQYPSWQQGYYPTIYSSAAEKWVMIMYPHIPRFQKNSGVYSSQLRMEGRDLTYWDIWVDDVWSVRYYEGLLMSVDTAGNFVAKGGGAFGSDIRYKDIIAYQQLDLETIANAPLFTFRWTDREDKVEHLGTSAQYWLDTQFKDAVNTTNKDFFHLDYGALAVGIGISVAREVKGVKTEVQLLRERVNQLEQELAQYRRA